MSKEIYIGPDFVSGKGTAHIKPRVGVHLEDGKAKTSEEVTKKPGHTSVICTLCGGKRKRSYGRSSPMTYERMIEHKTTLSDDGVEYNINKPRISANETWWNRGLIRWAICPEEDFPWFLCWEVATCQQCSKTVGVQENSYYRQFGRIRMLQILIREGPDKSGLTLMEALSLKPGKIRNLVSRLVV